MFTEEEMTLSENLEAHAQLSAACLVGVCLCFYALETSMLTEAAALFATTNVGSYLYEAHRRVKEE